ncbi:MAG: DUF2807 domain-containing protein [Flammeovirgaceae bacterium]|nr:DUF2807 domain-containing protein [Flammeovirgaceae bacterium]
MKNKILSIIFLLVSISFFANAQNKETRNLESFDEVEISGAFKVYISQGNKEEITIETKSADPKLIITEVRGNTLKIYPKDKSWRYGKSEATLSISFENMEKLSISGSIDVIGKTKVTSNNLVISSSGSGDIEMDIKTEAIAVHLSGSSDLELSGSTKKQEINISGSGDIDAFDLESVDSKISISGSGEAEISVSGSLSARIAGSGDVKYKGNPDLKDVRVAGSGHLSKAN